MCTYIYIYIYIYIYKYINTHAHTHTHIYIYIYIYTHIHACFVVVLLGFGAILANSWIAARGWSTGGKLLKVSARSRSKHSAWNLFLVLESEGAKDVG